MCYRKDRETPGLKKIKLHTKVKVTAPLLNESMNEFIIKAIQERIEKIESQKLGGE